MRSAPRISVDPRRKLGRHGAARKLLADAEVVPAARGAWHDLVSALQRHTVHNELAQLPRDDRHILSLAYVHGHSNREIAAMLNVSIRTVSRRLTAALARLEDSARRAGAWVSILGLAVVAWSARLAGGTRGGRGAVAALIAATAATAVTVGFVATAPPTFGMPSLASPSLAVLMPAVLPAAHRVHFVPVAVVEDAAVPVVMSASGAAGAAEQARTHVTAAAGRVCHGNPTSAPPAVPVGRRAGSPPPQPVTHPGPGGCGRS